MNGLPDHPNGPVQMIVRPKARKISLRLDHATCQATLVLPHKRYAAQGEKLLRQRSTWLSEQWQALPPPMPFVPDAKILFEGEPTQLVFEQGRGRARHIEHTLVVPATQIEAFATRVRRALIELARAALETQVAIHAQNLNLTPNGVTVRDTRSRWGSCSSAGNLNFSWRLICAPKTVLSYVAAHEVAHLREAHHGPAFWQEVARTYPEPAPARKYLRDHAPQLFAVGAIQ